jgi:hypothetical protein
MVNAAEAINDDGVIAGDDQFDVVDMLILLAAWSGT